MKTIIAKIANLANKIDSAGVSRIADRLDIFLHKLSNVRLKDDERLPEEKGLAAMESAGLEPYKLLGHGLEGNVYATSYNGNNAAVKVLPKGSNEVSMWKKILEVKTSMPDDLAKHIPQIYDIIETPDASLILMEMLAPLRSELAQLLFKVPSSRPEDIAKQRGVSTNKVIKEFRGGPRTGPRVEMLMKNEEFLYTLANKTVDLTLVNYRSLIPNPEKLKIDLHKQLLSVKHFEKSSIDDIAGMVCQQFPNQKERKILKDSLSFNLNFLLSTASSGGVFPGGSDEDAEELDILLDIPETRTLLQALRFLRQKGIHWEDLHWGNLMTRPSTGEAVIIDVNLYSIGPSQKQNTKSLPESSEPEIKTKKER